MQSIEILSPFPAWQCFTVPPVLGAASKISSPCGFCGLKWQTSQTASHAQVLSGHEDMVQIVEEARLAVAEAEQEARELRAAVASLQQERQQLLRHNASGAASLSGCRLQHACWMCP